FDVAGDGGDGGGGWEPVCDETAPAVFPCGAVDVEDEEAAGVDADVGVGKAFLAPELLDEGLVGAGGDFAAPCGGGSCGGGGGEILGSRSWPGPVARRSLTLATPRKKNRRCRSQAPPLQRPPIAHSGSWPCWFAPGSFAISPGAHLIFTWIPFRCA